MEILPESVHLEYDIFDFQRDIFCRPKTKKSTTPPNFRTYLHVLKCYICNLDFSSDIERMQHFMTFHSTKKFANSQANVRCKMCKATISSDVEILNKHYRFHYEMSTTNLCDLCGAKDFETSFQYQHHVNKHKFDQHALELAEKAVPDTLPLIIGFEVIEAEKHGVIKLTKESKDILHDKSEFLCEICGQRDFRLKRNYLAHLT